MEVIRERLEERFRAVSLEELRAIVAAPGEHTPMAREVAASVLYERRFERPEPPPPPPTKEEQERAARWEAWAALATMALFAKDIGLDLLRQSGVDGDGLTRAVMAMVQSPWAYSLPVMVAALLIGRAIRRATQRPGVSGTE
jgi:hypothetical protein